MPKIIATIFNYFNSIAALVANCPETYSNIKKLFKLTKLSDFNFCQECLDHVAGDMKVQNITIGLMGNQCTFPCIGCLSRSPFQFGDPDSNKLRTFGELRKLSTEYNASKAIKKSTKPADFFNIIHPPLFEGCLDGAWTHDVLTIAGMYLGV